MSGPVTPPLTVSDVADGGAVTGRPITTIEVTSGTLTVSGRVATLDTSGSGGSPATPKDTIQFNSDPAGTFTSDTFFKMSVIGGDGTTAIQAGNMILGGNKIAANTADQSVSVICDGTGEVFLNSAADAGGTYTNSVVNIMCNANTNVAQLKFRDQINTDNASVTLDGSGHLILNNNVAAKDIDLKVLTTGQVEVANQTTDTVSVLSIMGNGTGDARLDMQNASKRVWVVCDENKKLKVQGGSGGNTFIFDVSGAATGLTFPDGTTQTTAASGGSASFNPVLPKTIVSADRHKISLAAPYGGTALEVNAQFSDSQTCRGYPFIAPKSGDVDEIGIVVGTSTTSADCLVGIYTDNSGEPETLMGFADIEMSSTGAIYQTSISATVTLVEQTQYWFVIGGDDTITGGTLTALDDDYTCDLGIGWSPNGKGFCITHNASVTALPATFVPTSVHGTPRPLVSLKIG